MRDQQPPTLLHVDVVVVVVVVVEAKVL